MIRRKDKQVDASPGESKDEPLLVFCTCPDHVSAKAIALLAVEEFLAAGVNIISGVESVYRWRGQIEVAAEVQLLMQTTRGRFAALQHAVQRSHPYEVPELIAIPITDGLPSYLSWITSSTTAC